MKNAHSTKVQGRLERRERRVKDVVILADAGSSLPDEQSRAVIDLLRSFRAAGVIRAYVVGSEAESLREGLGTIEASPDVSFVHVPGESSSLSEALRHAMEKMATERRGSRPFFVVDAGLVLRDPNVVRDLASDPRPNVLAVELRLAHTIRNGRTKVQLEPVDVPWYTRRVVGLSGTLRAEFCHGESIGLNLIGESSFAAILESLRTLASDSESLPSDAFSQAMMAGHEFYTAALPASAFDYWSGAGDGFVHSSRASELAG